MVWTLTPYTKGRLSGAKGRLSEPVRMLLLVVFLFAGLISVAGLISESMEEGKKEWQAYIQAIPVLNGQASVRLTVPYGETNTVLDSLCTQVYDIVVARPDIMSLTTNLEVDGRGLVDKYGHPAPEKLSLSSWTFPSEEIIELRKYTNQFLYCQDFMKRFGKKK